MVIESYPRWIKSWLTGLPLYRLSEREWMTKLELWECKMIARSLMLGVAAAALMVSGAQAADLIVQPPAADPIYESPLFNFEGFYAGVQGGGYFYNGGGNGLVGVVAGANFAVSDAILAGLEFQGDAIYENSNTWTYDALLLAHLGAVVTDQVLVYAAAGVGSVDGQSAYALGGGVEVAVSDSVSVRGEVLGLGAWNNSNWSTGRATVGVLFHF
jgi:outer membrane immunogenic protein